MRIIGIDPGLRYLGWGVIEAGGPRLRHISNGVVEGVGDDLAPRLLALYDGLIAVLAEFAPDCAAVEQTFVNRVTQLLIPADFSKGQKREYLSIKYFSKIGLFLEFQNF